MYVYLLEYQFSVLWGRYLGVESLGHVVGLFHFLRNCPLFPKATVLFRIPTSNVGEGSSFSTISPILVIVYGLDSDHLSGYEVLSHGSFFCFVLFF